MVIHADVSEALNAAEWMERAQGIHLELSLVLTVHEQNCLEDDFLHFGDLRGSFWLSKAFGEEVKEPLQ